MGRAQSIFGGIVGVVKDPGQGAIAAAQIVLTNIDDRTQHNATTDTNGGFEFINLKAGRYELLVHANGFADLKMTSLQLDARQTLRADVELKVAAATQTVEVSGDSGPVINTENATIADSKDFQQITSLPVNYRGATTSSLAMLNTVPGVQADSNGNYSVGGGLPSQVQYSVDGSSTVNIRNNGALGNMNPSSELIAEFKVTQFNNNAEFAQLGDVTITTKTGTDRYHGSLFEYAQNSAFDATTYGSLSKPHKVFNTFGGSLGGPVWIPRTKQGASRTFFFADYEGNRRRMSTPLFAVVPTAEERAGNLSGLSSSRTDGNIIDPFTGQPFPGNTVPSACGAGQKDCINPVAKSLLQNYVPLPNYNVGGFNYLQEVATPSSTNGYDVRIDRTLTSKQSIYGRWSWKHLDSTVPNYLLSSDQDVESDKNFLISHNYLISNSLVNEARFGIAFYTIKVGFPIQGSSAISQLGLRGLDISDHPTTSAFPTFNFSDGTGFTQIGRDKTGTTQSRTVQFSDNLTWMKGKHTMKFGADVRRVGYVDIESFGGSDDFGQFIFNQGTFSGNSFADLLLGLPTKTYVAQSGPDVHAHTTQTGVYAQDEWRVSNKLTLTYGLRWQALPPFVSPLGNLTAFDARNGGIIYPGSSAPRPGFLETINTCNPSNPNDPADPCGGPVNSTLGCAPVNPALPCGPATLASAVGLGPGVREFYKRNFQPRIGFAYRPFGNNKTVVRGGFGIFTMTNLGQLSFNTTNIHVSVVRTTQNSISGGQAAYQFPNVRTLDSPLSIAGTGDFYQNTPIHYRDPQSAQWNFTVERELIRDLTLRVSYLGMNSYRMSQTVDLNQVRPNSTGYNPALRPYQNWGRILTSTNEGNMNYEGLQSELNQRFRGGLTMQASHVWAHSLGNVGGDAPTAFSPEIVYGTPVANRFDLSANRGNVAATRRHRVLVSALYQIPVGQNRRFFGRMKTLPEAAFGGWSVSTVSMWQTGPYLTPTTSPSIDPANTNLAFEGALLKPNCIGNGNLANPTPLQYFNASAFANPTPNSGRIGNCGVGILVGPGTTAIATGLSKTFQIGERLRLRFEGTFTNVLNHPNFAPPSGDFSSLSTFGQTTSVQTAENSGNRTGQLSLRLDF